MPGNFLGRLWDSLSRGLRMKSVTKVVSSFPQLSLPLTHCHPEFILGWRCWREGQTVAHLTRFPFAMTVCKHTSDSESTQQPLHLSSWRSQSPFPRFLCQRLWGAFQALRWYWAAGPVWHFMMQRSLWCQEAYISVFEYQCIDFIRTLNSVHLSLHLLSAHLWSSSCIF